ncbi:uncharacterized protein [Dermacentor albipictus]|uniref:uncharacterized protein n=1 Tax=Dermacentor albipictus TaxID=60249 RepID=UPI0031FCA25C
MVLWFRKRKKEAPGTASESPLPTRESLARRIRHATIVLSRKMFQSKVFVCLVVLLLLALAAVCGKELLEWGDRRYPKPPLGIITGELLKGFERYSPDYNHTEEVLADVMRAETPRTVPCDTLACQWLEAETGYDALSLDRPLACQDFYEHVCWRFEGPPIYERASLNLMVQVADYLTYMADSAHDDSDVREDVSMLRKCIDGDSSAASFALNCNFGVRKFKRSKRCPVRYPSLPFKAVDHLLTDHSLTSVKEFLSTIKRYGEVYSVEVRLELGIPELREGMTTERADSFCSWLGESASCHLQERFNASDDDIRMYQRLWNELYFAPLFLPDNVSSSMWDLFGNDGDQPRKLACVNIHEGLFQSESAQAAVAVLEERLTEVDRVTSDLFYRVVDAMNIRVPTWLSRHAEGEDPQLQRQRRPVYQAELESVHVELLGMSDAAATDYETSVYSWQARYDFDRNVLIVPQGLLAVMADMTYVVEPISSVFLFTQLMRPLLPQPSGPYSWKYAHDQHLAYVTGCLRSVHNASIDFDGNPGLLLEFALESALLGPLYDVYHRDVHESVGAEVYFNHRYTNSQLLFVLWAMSHCGTRQGAELVNAAVRNSMRFGRIFNCGIGDPMFSRRKCNFWVYW